MKLIDIIIPVYKPGAELEKLLECLKKQSVVINKIILMHTEDGCNLEWVIRKFENVDICSIRAEEFDHGGTRHKGICGSDADIVVCMTQDAVPMNEHLIARLIEPLLQNDEIVISYARQIPKDDCHVLERYTRKFNYPGKSLVKSKKDIEKMGIKTFFCSNVCAAYKKDKYFELGGFEVKTIFNEDMIFAANAIEAGYKISYTADACVKHSHNYTGFQQIKRNFDLAVSQADHPEIFEKVRSESEGIRMVKNTAAYLVKIRKPWLIIELVVNSGCKYVGYFLGKHYHSLPEKFIMRITMNPRYWKN